MVKRPVIVTIIFALLATPAIAASGSPFGSTVREQVGVNIHFSEPMPGEMDMLAGAGFGLIRMDMFWDGIEKKPGVYDFSHYDTLMSELQKKHMRALLILDYANPLYDDNKVPHTDAGIAAFSRFAVAAVQHFQGRQVLWEMWNEPNWGDWFTPYNGDGYAKLAVAVGKALHEAAPGETYVGPALGGMDPKFLEACFKDGALDYWQAVTVHPYRPEHPESVESDYAKVHALIAQYEPAGKTIPLIAGEWGVSVMPQKQVYSWVKSEPEQAAYFDREVLYNYISGIDLTIWYDWRDDHDAPDATEANFGLVHNAYHEGRDPVFDPKPSYFAAKTLIALLGDYHYAGSLDAADSPAVHVASFARGRDRRYGAWTTSDTPVAVTLAIPSGKYTVVDMYGKTATVATADASGLPITLTGDPQFVLRGGK